MAGLHETIYSIFRLLTRDLMPGERAQFAIVEETVTCPAHWIAFFSDLILKFLTMYDFVSWCIVSIIPSLTLTW